MWLVQYDIRLDALSQIEIDQEKLDINPNEAKSDEDLADWICEEMKIKKVEGRLREMRRRAVADDEDEDEKPASSRLRDMRRGRD